MHRTIPLCLLLLVVSFMVFGNNTIEPIKDPFSNLRSIAGTKQHKLFVKQLDQTYYLHVRLPAAEFEGKLPVVYLLDGGIHYATLSSYYHTLALLGDLPPMIIVGINYGTDDWRKGNNRGRDFTAPSPDADRKHWGGANAFIQVLSRDVLPFIEANYPADPNKRVLMGTSLGGQFGIYVASHRPGLFHAILANNPAIHTNTQFYISRLEKLQTRNPLKLFIGMAGNDAQRFVRPRQQWLAALAKLEAPPWHLELRPIPGHTHLSSATEVFRQGLMWVFAE